MTRKFNTDIIEKFQAGYGSGKTTLFADAFNAGIGKDLLKKAGLIRFELDPESTENADWTMVDAYVDRVIFPILDTKGNTVAFTARNNSDNPKAPKYLNSPSSVWEKNRNLYGLFQAQDSIRKADKAYLVEGPTDVWRMHTKGLENTVSPCGTALTDEQCKLLHKFTNKVTIVPDNDQEKGISNPGLKALKRNALLLLKHGFYVKVLIPGVGSKTGKNTDPDTFLGNMRTEEQFTRWMGHEVDYIEKYLCSICLAMAEGTADQKFAAVKLMADTLEEVSETGYRNALYDNVSKDWPYFKKEYRPHKRDSEVVHTDVDRLKRDARDEYFKHKFIEEDGMLITWEKSKKKELSNFTFRIIFTVSFFENKEEHRKSVLSVNHVFGYRTLTVVNIDDFCSSQVFKKILRRRGDFLWKGNDEQLDNVYEKVFLNAPRAIELDRMGWNNKYKFWVWSNGIYYDGNFHKMDRYGLI